MTSVARVLAYDLGASSGRAFIGELDLDTHTLRIHEIHRFDNDPVQVGEHLYWDILRLFHELKQGLLHAQRQGYTQLESLGIDSWAVDFGLLDQDGELLSNPYHYRDLHTQGIMETIKQQLGESFLYQRTGIQFLPFNTIYQLLAIAQQRASVIAQADVLLMIPDVLRYFLTGIKQSEITNASTTQLYNPRQGRFDEDILQAIGIPSKLMPELIEAGTIVGTLSPSIQAELGVEAIQVIAVGEHDTASAVAAVPALEAPFAYISSGTWSLLGTETQAPVLTDLSLQWNFTNEAGVYQSNRLLKNIMGLWLIQSCKREWDLTGESSSYTELTTMAATAEPFRSLINPDDVRFLHHGHMLKKIQQYCTETNQPIPHTKSEFVRCILESLAFAYRNVFAHTEELANTKFHGLHIVGGGTQNELLCQFTANAIGRPVWAGPIEASAIGNILVQFITLGHIANLQEGRRIVHHSFPIKQYLPVEQEQWNQTYLRFQELLQA